MSAAKPSKSSSDEDSTQLSHGPQPQGEKMRWFVLSNFLLFGSIAGANLYTFGPVNDVMAKYFQKPPEYIDYFLSSFWFTDSFVFVPLSVLSLRIGYRKMYISQQITTCLGLGLITIAWFSRDWYLFVLIGQICTGAGTVMISPLASQIAATWFPADEVAVVVALGNVLPCLVGGLESTMISHLVDVGMEYPMVKLRFLIYFGSMASALLVVTISTFMFFKEQPTKPPGYAQAHVAEFTPVSLPTALGDCAVLFRELIKDRQFLAVAFSLVTVKSGQNATVTLLSSQMHLAFPRENQSDRIAGYMLLGLQGLLAIGGLLCGLSLSKYRNYKVTSIAANAGVMVAYVFAFIGFETQSVLTVGFGTFLLGFCMGASITAHFELLREVTYPKPVIQVTLLVIGLAGVITFLLITAERAIIEQGSAVGAVALSFGISLLSTVLLAFQKTDLRRLRMDKKEGQPILNEGLPILND